jgi:elongator complex protein 4
VAGRTGTPSSQAAAAFCHSYDLSKSLEQNAMAGQLHATPLMSPLEFSQELSIRQSPFKAFLKNLTAKLKASPSSNIHRVAIPSLLSPSLYSSAMCQPSEVLQFLQGLRSLLRQFSGQLTAVVTLPASLYPRTTGLTRWMELLFDGVLAMIPLQQQDNVPTETKPQEPVQGLLKIHSLPIHNERGGGSETGRSREDLTFRLGVSSGLVIRPFSLPPIGGPETAESNTAEASKTQMLEF